ncbi:beta strand repeat-containing protein [Nitrospira moscoviensis]|uniref:Fibronectin type-III domain-containing protein n=1 Tax=Nitrospira moscoviensis TaxID=42253 RepID=A0A0K2GD83_NITMO|nr:fibronectin type III domain-containing protein [Nitrospira moscoviensis]ALA58834.1 exported protein of unknown function [Nitrospira moscoviensis]
MAHTRITPTTDKTLSLPRRSLLLALGLALIGGLVAPMNALALQLSPSSLNFSATQGGGAPSSQTLTFWKNSQASRSWTTTARVPWLSASPSSGSLTTERDQVHVMVNPAGLAPGAYSSSLIITTTGADGTIRKTAVPVSLTVTSGSSGGFTITPPSLSYTGTVNGPNQVAGVVVTNTGSSPLTVTWHDNIGWLIATSGDTVTMPPGGSATISHTASPSLWGVGTFTGVATITGGGVTKHVPVTMTVTKGSTTPSIGLSPASLAYSGTVGGANPAPQVINVSNSGGGTLTWTATDNAAWLTVTPATGTNSGTLTASVNLSGLAAGTYHAAVTISGSGVTAKTVPVTLTVSAAAAPAIGLNPTSLSFSGTVGGANPAAKSIGISNAGGGTLTWTASDNAAWLTLSPTSGTNSGTVSASVNLSGLAAGTYNAAVTISATGAAAKTVPVTLTVNAPTTSPSIGFSPTSLTFSATAGGSNPAGKSFIITNPGGGTLTWSISDNAAWLSVTPTSGTTTTETDTLTASVNLSGLAVGTYNGTITITAAGASNSPRTIPVTLTVSAATAGGTATLSWNANGESDLGGYKIYRATASGAYGAPIATLSKTTTSYVVTGLQAGTTYFFVITAYDSAGHESVFSNEVSKSIF